MAPAGRAPGHTRLSIARQYELIGLPRASYYREVSPTESEEYLDLIRLIRLIRVRAFNLNEPPWYGPVCPVVSEGRRREAPPILDY